jgi:D-alanyl-D-alanine carboxypeptidase
MPNAWTRCLRAPVVVCVAVLVALSAGTVAGAAGSGSAATTLQRALDAFVKGDDAPPGIAVMVQNGSASNVYVAGVADIETGAAWAPGDAMRMASVAKAFSGAAAVSAVADGKLSLDDTVGKILPDQPSAWGNVTLAQLLQHTSGVPDFSGSETFRHAVQASPTVSVPPEQLLSYVADQPLAFPPGSKYEYSNSDNVLVGLMVAAVDGRSYPDSLVARVYTPLGLTTTSLPEGPEMPAPFVHGYQPDPPLQEDVSEVLAGGWSWASGGIVSSLQDANRFVRGYASGQLTDAATRKQQFTFRKGSSSPPGPGTNSVGLAIFRYRTRCGTVYGHTGNTPGYTQFVAATGNGKQSVVVSINSQLNPHVNAEGFAPLRRIYGLAVCAALQ